MYTIHLPVIGEVVLRLATIRFWGFNIYISGHDEDRNAIDITLDRLVYPDDNTKDYGYCHIVSYSTQGRTVPCNMYSALH